MNSMFSAETFVILAKSGGDGWLRSSTSSTDSTIAALSASESSACDACCAQTTTAFPIKNTEISDTNLAIWNTRDPNSRVDHARGNFNFELTSILRNTLPQIASFDLCATINGTVCV